MKDKVIPKFKKEYLKNSNLLIRKSFGDFSINYLYDLRDRLMTITYSNEHLMIKRLGYSSKDTDISFKPTMIQLPNGNKYMWRYDKEGNVISLKTPSGAKEEIHKFWKIYGGIKNDYIRYYRSFPYLTNNHLLKENNKSVKENYNITIIDKFLLILDENEKISSYMTPDNEKNLFVKRNIFGKIENINIDRDLFIYKYNENSKDSRIKDIIVYEDGEIIQRRYDYIGFLVRQVNETRGKNKITVNYEYDNFLRLTSQIFKLNGNIINHEFINYENNNLIETTKEAFKTVKKINENRQLIEEDFILYNKSFIKVIYNYDLVGRVIKRKWYMKNEKYLSEKKEFGINGELIYYMSDSTDEKKEWNLYYDTNERLRKINDKLIEKDNGIVKKFKDVEYQHDKNGFIIKRGEWEFKYDVLGRLRGGKKDNIEILYKYDNKGYIISKTIKKNNKIIDGIEFLYDDSRKLKYYWNKRNNDDVWSVNYDKESGAIKSIIQNDDSYWIVTDNERSIRYIIGNYGELVYEINYTPTGMCLRDRKPRPFILPIGYRGYLEDTDMNIVFVEEYSELLNIVIIRPLDVYTGRFMSLSIDAMNPRINLLFPEIISDLFGYAIGEKVKKIKFSLLEWLKYSGYDLAPIKYHFTKSKYLHNECSPSKVVLSSYICEGIESINNLNNILSINDKTIEVEDKFISKTFGNQFIENNNLDITFVEKSNGHVSILRKNNNEDLSLDILEKILMKSQYLPVSSEMILNRNFIVMHFVKDNPGYIEKDEILSRMISQDVQLKLFYEIKQLIFTIKDRIFKIYYSKDISDVKQGLKNEFYNKMNYLTWGDKKDMRKGGINFVNKNLNIDEMQ